MYNMGDDTYLKQPKFMSRDTIRFLAAQLKKYCTDYGMRELYIGFHGGEPLLASVDFYRFMIGHLKEVMTDIKLFFIMQTNGTLLDDQWCAALKDLDVQVGISIDGPEDFHDIHRVYHNNKGSYHDVLKGVEKRNEYGVGGIISVINIAIPPADLYDLYKSLKSPAINILLPDGHYQNLPGGFEDFEDRSVTPYGDWLIALYELWKADKNERPNIAFFKNIISVLLGYDKGDELIGKRKNGAICIETDGAIEVVDPLRICGNGFTKNKLNVRTHEITEIEKLPLFDVFYNSHDILSGPCEQCLLKNICGGGYLPHRYSQFNGFDNPSIYCKDLTKIITYIQNDIVNSLPEDLINEVELELVSAEDVHRSILNPLNLESATSRLLQSFKKDFVILNN